jgi:hypothetical protein
MSDRYRAEPIEEDEYGCRFGVVCDSSIEPGAVIICARFYEKAGAEECAKRGNDYVRQQAAKARP